MKRYGTRVACCGMAGDTQLKTSVFPFILRGVSLIGIDSVYHPMERRKSIWEEINSLYEAKEYGRFVTQISPREIIDAADSMLSSNANFARTIINCSEFDIN